MTPRLPRPAGQGDAAASFGPWRWIAKRSADRPAASAPVRSSGTPSVPQPKLVAAGHGDSAGAAAADPGARTASAARTRADDGSGTQDRPRYTHRRKVEAGLDVLIWK